MKIVNIIGGLGNQMFQYAFALSLKERFADEEVLIDTSHFHYLFLKKIKSANLHNGFEIEKVFSNACIPIASARQLRRVTRYIPNYLLSRVARKYLPVKDTEILQTPKDYFAYDPEIYHISGDRYFEGIWEAISYHLPYRKQIQQVFAHPEPNQRNAGYIRDMEAVNSVGIHVRRGDYLYHPDFRDICDLDFYRRAIEEILKDGSNHVFYIFSNDFPWCEENIKPLLKGQELEFVICNTGEHSCWDMFLMSHCQDLIIANSSFSWWGAFLNERSGRVVAPAKWTNRVAEYDMWAPEWIRI